MDFGNVVTGFLGLFQAGQIRVHHRTMSLYREDQRHVDRNSLGEHRGDRRYTFLHRGDLDEEVRPVDDFPQLDGLSNRFLLVAC